MRNDDYARARLPVPMVALFGRALSNQAAARDLDVVFGGMSPEEACKIVRQASPDLAHLPLDMHEGEWFPPQYDKYGGLHVAGRYAALQAVEETDPVEPLVGRAVAPKVKVNQESLPRAVRYYARHGRWPVTSARVGLDLAESKKMNYFGGGLTALRTAFNKLGLRRAERVRADLGVLAVLLNRDPTVEERALIGPTLTVWCLGAGAPYVRRPYGPTDEQVGLDGGRLVLVRN